MFMLFGILTLITALAIAGVAAWFSIVGLMLLFSGMPMSIAVMAGTLEVGKLLTASWLYRYWNETSIMLRAYLTTAVVILMVITSIGIFGYLSKTLFAMERFSCVNSNALGCCVCIFFKLIYLPLQKQYPVNRARQVRQPTCVL